MAKTLIDFRAEKGLYLKDVSETTGIPEEELRAIEESGTVPPEIAEILINDYHLTDTYFTVEEIGKLTPENPTRYFLKISIVFYVLSALAAGVPMLVTFVELILKPFIPSLNDFPITYSLIYTVLSSVWAIVISILGYILFANYILKHTTFKGDIKKHQFLHHSIPSGVIAFISMATACITTFSSKSADINNSFLLWQLINGIISWIAIGLAIAIHVKLLNTAIENDISKKQKTFKTFAIIVTISSVLAFALTIISQILLQDFNIFVIIRRIFVYGFYIAIAWAVALTNPDDEKQNKIAFTILPLISICQSFVFTVIGLFV